jgi:hypothetical protein
VKTLKELSKPRVGSLDSGRGFHLTYLSSVGWAEVSVDVEEQHGVIAVGVWLHDPALPFVVEAKGTERGLFELSMKVRTQQPLDQRKHPDLNQSIRLANPSGRQVVRIVEEWVRLGLEVGRNPSRRGKVPLPEASSVEEALARVRSALTGNLREPGTRKRGEAKQLLLEDVVEKYRQAIQDRHRYPRKVVADQLGYSSEHIGRLLVEARKATPERGPLLGPAARGKAGEVPATSPPARKSSTTKPPAQRATGRGKS